MGSLGSRVLWSLPIGFLAVTFGWAREASASAMYFAEARAVMEFTGLEHAGGGIGVNVYSAYYVSGGYNGVGGTCSDCFADYSFDAATPSADRIEVSASAFGWAADGSASSSSANDGGFWIGNSSSFDATGVFLVSGRLTAGTDVSHTSLGQAFANASIALDSAPAGTFGGTSVGSSTTAGAHSSSLVFGPTLYSITVPPGEGRFIYASPYAEGFVSAAVAVPVRVPEPGFLTLLAVGLAAARFRIRRKRGPEKRCRSSWL